MISREFNLYLHAGHSIPLVINCNQYDRGEQWLFTLFNADGTQYVPSSGAIVGIKSDNLGIINSGTVDASGRVVINETQQMTAAVGKAVFELLIDDQTHGTANFVVLVEPKPGDNADLSESDYSLFQQAIDGTSATAIAEGVADWMDENLTPTTPVVDASLTVSGAAADAKKTGDEISDLKSQIAQSAGLTEDIKQALLEIASTVGYRDGNGDEHYDRLYDALYPPTNLSYITAVYTQGGTTVYDTDSLDVLKPNLVVTGHYTDSSTETITTYALSGELEEGTSTITVSYMGKTTTFDVTVTHIISGWYYPFDGSLLSAGSEDFGFTGTANYATGFDGVGQAYHHISKDEAESDVAGIKAIGIENPPAFGNGDFTISFWFKSTTELRGHMFEYAKFYSTGSANSNIFSSFTKVDQSWTYTKMNISLKYAGIAIYYASSMLNLTFVNSAHTKSNAIQLTPPSGFSTNAWHHYALTRDGTTFRIFVDGSVIFTMESSEAIYDTNQVCVGSLFGQTSGTATDTTEMSYGDIIDDLYVAKFCKWKADFDPTTIRY